MISQLETKTESCPDLKSVFHTKVHPSKCESTKYGILCLAEVIILSQPRYVTKFVGFHFDGCTILTNYYMTDYHGIISLDCIDEYCKIVPPNSCVLGIINQNVADIRKFCELGYSEQTISKGEISFIVNKLSSHEYMILRQTFPVLGEQMQLPIAFIGGQQNIKIDSIRIKANYPGQLQLYIPKPSFNTSLLCPNSTYVTTQYSYVKTYLVSCINTLLILSLVGMYNLLKRFRKCGNKQPQTTVHFSDSNPPRHLAVTYEPQDRSLSPGQRDIYNLLRLATREE